MFITKLWINCCVWEREKEKESGLQGKCLAVTHLQIYSRWRYLSREPCFFVLLSLETDTGLPFPQDRPPPTELRPQTEWLLTLCLRCWLTALLLGLKTSVVIYFSNAYIILFSQFTWLFHCPLFTLRHSSTSCFKIHN